MAVRSIIDIDVDDASFKAFMETFERYRAAVAQTPRIWGQVNTAQEAGKTTLSEMAALMAAQTDMLRRTLRESEAIRRTTEGTGLAMGRLARSTKEVAGNLISATASLLKWTGMSTAITGLLGVGGLWGLDRLAVSASGMRRTSMGLNMSPGEMSAARAYQSVLGDPRQMLSGLMHSLESGAGKGVFIGAGMQPSEYEGRNASQVLGPFLKHIQELSRTTPQGFESDVLKSRGLEGVVPLELFNQLRTMSRGQIDDLITLHQQYQSEIQIHESVLRKWAMLDTQLGHAGDRIQAVVIDGLVPLTDPLIKLSSAFSNAVTAFLKGPAAGKLIEGMTHGLERFAEYVGKDDFIKDVEKFTTGVGAMASAIASFVEWFAKTDIGKKAAIAAGAYTGLKVGGPVGAVIGAGAAAAASSDAGRTVLGFSPGGATADEADFVRAAREWSGDYNHPEQHPGFADFVRNYRKAHNLDAPGPASGPQSNTGRTRVRPGQVGAVGPQSNPGGARILSLSEMVSVARQAGWSDAEAPQIAAIAMAESQGNTMALGRAGEHGVTQILPGTTGAHRFAAEARGNALRAMQLALEIKKSEGWKAWSVYNDKSYLRNMPGASGSVPSSNFDIQASSPDSMIDETRQLGVGFGYGKMVDPKGMVVHHTGGGKNIDDVLKVFRQRGVASNYVIDRQGNIYRTLPEGAAGRHIKQGWGAVGEGRSNENMEGVEIIAADDNDVNAAEKAAALRLIKQRSEALKYDPKTSVFGHGEVNPGHRQAREGMGVVDMVRGGALIQPQHVRVHAPHNLIVRIEHDGVSPPTAVNQVAR